MDSESHFVINNISGIIYSIKACNWATQDWPSL